MKNSNVDGYHTPEFLEVMLSRHLMKHNFPKPQHNGMKVHDLKIYPNDHVFETPPSFPGQETIQIQVPFTDLSDILELPLEQPNSKEPMAVNDVLPDDVPMTIIDFSEFVSEEQKRTMKAFEVGNVMPPEFLFGETGSGVVKTVRQKKEYYGKTYWVYIQVPAWYKLKEGETFVEPMKAGSLEVAGVAIKGSNRFPTKF